MARACSSVGGQGDRWPAPHAETAVRSASMGWPSGQAHEDGQDAPRAAAPGQMVRGSQVPVQSSLATVGYVPLATSSPIG